MGFTAASIGVRIALLAVTIGLSGVWYRAYRDVRRGLWFPVCGSWHHSPRCVLLHQAPARMPHVRWVSLLLFVMLCWQNPLVVVGQLFPRLIAVHAIAEVCPTPMRCGYVIGHGFTTVDHGLWRAQVLHSIAWAGMMTFWLMMIDGLRYERLPAGFYRYKVCPLLPAMVCAVCPPRRDWCWMGCAGHFRRVFHGGHIGTATVQARVVLRAFCVSHDPGAGRGHHHCGGVGLCCRAPGAGVLACVVHASCLSHGARAEVAALHAQPLPPAHVSVFAVPTKFGEWLRQCACVCACEAGASLELRHCRGGPSVYQVVLFVIGVNALPAFRFVFDAAGDTRAGGDRGGVSHLVSVLVGAYQPLGELLLLSVYTYMVVVLFLPPNPDRSASRGFLKGVRYVVLLAHAESRWCQRLSFMPLVCICACGSARKRVAKATGFVQPLFSLETACWLFDLAWEAYYDPPGFVTDSSCVSLRVCMCGCV